MILQHLFVAVVAAVFLSGCVHPLVFSPDITKVEREVDNPPRIKKNVGYYIDDKVKNQEVNFTLPGGDGISYFPYRDIETTFDKMLSNVFENVTKLNSPADSMKKNEINFVITPVIATFPSGDGMHWAPTGFKVDLTCNIKDASGTQIANTRVVGEGQAGGTEFICFGSACKGVAGKRAMEDALQKMQRSLFDVKYDNVRSSAGSAGNPMPALPKESATERLEKLKVLSDRGLISREEFEQKKKEILDSM